MAAGGRKPARLRSPLVSLLRSYSITGMFLGHASSHLHALTPILLQIAFMFFTCVYGSTFMCIYMYIYFL